jgi:threonylcarbamoyladenosine tRNA methylthiotransferase MtaB
MPEVATFTVDFLGCKISHVDAREIGDRLALSGHVETRGEADLAVISTCCVTREAVKKSRKAARRAARRAGQVYVTGCAANLEGALGELPENVTVVSGESERTATAVEQSVGTIGCAQASFRRERVRAFVKIQDGCSFSCSFCVIPRVRGSSRSRTADAILGEIRRRAAEGHREIVLTGINLGCYRDRAAAFDLPRLVREAGAIPGVARLRLSSVEINHVTKELVAAMRETPTVSPHLHVPLQSGDDGVLRAMARRYTAEGFLRRLEPASDFNLTTDVIVGFPSEDEHAFRRTLETVERAGITKVHVFPYSPRPGTRTAADDSVSSECKRERSARLRALSHERCLAAWRAKIGAEDTVLVDREGRGYGNDYSPWLVSAAVGELVRVRARAVTGEGILGS